MTHKEAPDKYEGIIFADETVVGNHKMEASTVSLTDYAGNYRIYSDTPEVTIPKSESEQLPNTGETGQAVMMFSGVTTFIAGAWILRRRKKL